MQMVIFDQKTDHFCWTEQSSKAVTT